MRTSRESSPIVFGITVAIGVTLLFNLGAAIVGSRVDPSLLPWVIAGSQLMLMLAPTVFLARAMPIAPREMFRLRGAHWTMYAAAALGVLLLWPLMQTYMTAQELYLVPDAWFDKYRDIQRDMDMVYREFIRPKGGVLNLVQAFIVGALVPAIAEEALFRGAVQRSFEERLRTWGAIILASLVFVALHLHPVNAVPLMVVSVFLGLLARASGSLYPAILGHFLFNGTMVVALALEAPGRSTTELQSVDDLIAGAPYAALALVPAILLFRWLVLKARRNDLRRGEEASDPQSYEETPSA